MFKVKSEIEINWVVYSTKDTSLDLSEIWINDEDMKRISDYIMTNARLKKLIFRNNNISDKWIEELFHSMSVNDVVEELDLSYNFIHWTCFDTLSKYLENSKWLKRLNLSYNFINDEWVWKIINWLKKNISLKELNLFDNKIWLEWIKNLTQALVVNKHIEKIHISLYSVWLQWAMQFVQVLKLNKKLEIIY